ncbi:alpha/beta hydrolase [Volucribacter amazonae]|uniref:Hydrolase n=1 Tax=Volucribacter amazonae TaxID=256731 RepID=A0A9X4PPM9_9PAST|nr:alpha/beta hydrolase [Volucribacter amazonae]MDG6895298.1 hydrolase [Volucribacter amazonae]
MKIPDSHFSQFALQTLLPFAERFPLQYFQGKKGINIAYRHFNHNAKATKLLIVANGRAENILKWTEVAYDFYQQGYDILLFDHRGQGYSQRLLKDKHKGYIDDFRFYVEDMANLIENLTALYPYSQQFLLAHSMGALISSFYLANYPHHIDKAVFSSPFFAIPYPRPYSDELIINVMMLLGQGKRYVFGKGDYAPANLNNNHLSTCRTRICWHNRIQRKYHHLRLGGPTFRWLHLSAIAIKQLNKLLPRIEIPLMLLQAEKDSVVCNKTLPELTALLPQGQLQLIAKAKHEILFERDSIRQPVIAYIQDFFAN